MSSQLHQEKNLPELLAPAGSPEAFRAAVAAGADAVYLSGKMFGARKFARNFTDAEIEEAITYAHGRDVSVYVTINTLIHDRELGGVAEYLIWLYSIGVDAVLIQDTGVMALARKIVPEFPLHASTQMTIHNSEGVRWAAEQGFSRVVLARELSLEDITRIARETAESGIGLEVFAHGALCYCYSGQCLLSSVIGGRSGNRGMCAQPCRKPYTLVTGEPDGYGRPTLLKENPSSDRFLLSPKDLCTYKDLRALVNSPVISLKIEGRMKSPEYVATVVSKYRRALDAIGAGTLSDSGEALPDLYLAFNRGFTSGYLFGKRHTAFMGRNEPDNRGYCIGGVSQYDEKSKMVTIRSDGSYVPRPGDGLLFTPQKDPRNEFGFSLNTVPLQKDGLIRMAVPHPVEPGTRVFITRSIDLDARARHLISHPDVGLRHPIPVDLTVTVDSGNTLVFEGLVYTRHGRKIPVVHRSDFPFVPARSHPLTREQLEQQVKKTGGTPFAIRTFSLRYNGDLFAPLAVINQVRREFFARAEEMLVAAFRPHDRSVAEAWHQWNAVQPDITLPATNSENNYPSSLLSLVVCTDSLEGVQKGIEGGCDVICFEPVFTTPAGTCRLHTGQFSFESQVIAGSRLCRDTGVRFVVKLPKITNNACLDAVLPVAKKVSGMGITDYMVENYGAAHALIHMDPAPVLSGSIGLNVFNHRSAQYLASWFTSLTLSPELSRDEIRVLIHRARSQGRTCSFALVVQGCSEAMVSEDCILQPLLHCDGKGSDTCSPAFFGIRDTTGHVFPVRTDGECRSHIYNSAEICLIDHLPTLIQVGINEVIIDARGRPGTYTGEMTRLYREAITRSEEKIRSHDPPFEELKESVKRLTLGGLTAGHFIRGLKES